MTEKEEKELKLQREKEFLYWLCQAPWLGAVSIRRIGEAAGGFEQAYYIEGTELGKLGIFRKEENCIRYDHWKKEFTKLREEYLGLGQRGITFLTPLDESYPRRLLHIYDYPMGLYVKGNLPEEDRPTAAVIGARECTAYGKQMAEYMGEELAAQGVQIISGLALGIDGGGHRGALRGGGKTFGVLGCGVCVCYPRSHYSLFQQILSEGGGLISEYPPDTGPLARNFPIRNRIISGLSDAVLILEARQKSGSLITAELGLEQGKEIFALPGRITDPLSEGCNRLIREGAAILTSPSDVLEHLGRSSEKTYVLCGNREKGLAKNEKMVYSCLDSEPRHLEQIAAAVSLPVNQCMNLLLELELGGLAVRTVGLYYIRGLV